MKISDSKDSAGFDILQFDKKHNLVNLKSVVDKLDRIILQWTKTCKVDNLGIGKFEKTPIDF